MGNISLWGLESLSSSHGKDNLVDYFRQKRQGNRPVPIIHLPRRPHNPRKQTDLLSKPFPSLKHTMQTITTAQCSLFAKNQKTTMTGLDHVSFLCRVCRKKKIPESLYIKHFQGLHYVCDCNLRRIVATDAFTQRPPCTQI